MATSLHITDDLIASRIVKIYAPVVAPKMSTEKLRDLLTFAFRKKLDKTTGSMRVRLL